MDRLIETIEKSKNSNNGETLLFNGLVTSGWTMNASCYVTHLSIQLSHSKICENITGQALPGRMVIMQHGKRRRRHWLKTSIFLRPAQWTLHVPCLCNAPLFVIRRLWVDWKGFSLRGGWCRTDWKRNVWKVSWQFKHPLTARWVNSELNYIRGDFVHSLKNVISLSPAFTYPKKSPFWKCSHPRMWTVDTLPHRCCHRWWPCRPQLCPAAGRESVYRVFIDR